MGLDLGTAGLGDDLAQRLEVLDIAGVDGEVVVRRRRVGIRGLGMRPARVSSRAGIYDRVGVRA